MSGRIDRTALNARIVSQLFSTGINEQEWRNQAACTAVPVEDYDRLFFPSTDAGAVSYGPGLDIYNEGKKVCIGCPVREECLQYALEQHERHGLWGGLAPTERLAIEARGSEVRFTGAIEADRVSRGVQWCSDCQKELPEEKFTSRGLWRCRECSSKHMAAHRQKRMAS